MWAGTSPYSEIVIAQSPVYGKVLFLDREIQSAESDEALYHEHLIHPVLHAKTDVLNKRVLIVGGGEGATAREVLKWSAEQVQSVTWVDIDGGLVDLCRRHLAFADDSVYNDARLTYFAEDIRYFLATSGEMYDIVVLDLPDPDVEELSSSFSYSSLEEYPLYSHAFFSAVLEHLNPGGAVVTHCGPIRPGGSEAMTREGLHWIRSVAKETSLGEGFAYHTCIPSFQGEWGYWMSTPPVLEKTVSWPSGLRVMDDGAQNAAFFWPAFWNSQEFGNI